MATWALTIAGVAEARADWLWDGHRRVAAVTAAGADGVPLDAQSFATLAAALASSGEEGVAVTLLNHRPRSFAAAAGLAINPAYTAREVLDAAAAALSAAFGFSARRLAQPVYPSEVVAVLQSVAGRARCGSRRALGTGWPCSSFRIATRHLECRWCASQTHGTHCRAPTCC